MIRLHSRRLGRRLALLTLALSCLFASLLLIPTAAQASTEDFTYESWHGRYEIGLDSDGQAIAHVTETLVAEFPDFEQNKGIVRALPLRYEGAPAAPEDISVTDADGKPLPFFIEEDETFRAILTGNNQYVTGTQSYVISYTLHDIILAATETQVDEFYWDLVAYERRQDIGAFSAEVVFAPELASSVTGTAACYQGFSGTSSPCTFDLTPPTEASDGSVEFIVPPTALPRGTGVTVAIALESGSVAQPAARLPNAATDVAPMLLAGAGVASGAAGAVVVRRLRRRRGNFRGTVVAQYDVPTYLPPLIAGAILRETRSPLPAEFVHLAVRGALRIEEATPAGKTALSKSAPVLRLLDPSLAPDELDQRTVAELFPSLVPDTALKIPRSSSSFSSRMQKLWALGKKSADTRGYFTMERSRTAMILSSITIGLLFVAAGLLAVGALQSRDFADTVAISGAAGVAALALALFGFAKHRVHTPLGAESREYLEGVREFIRVAEADRLRFLQSYSGADRSEDGSVNVIHLYELLLPYAMLFGLEKEWGKVLEVTYRDHDVTAPLWYPALGMHGLNRLDSTLSSFTSSLSSATSYTSSSSGGSSGGGFSGGGGGGGFSGGR